MLKLINLEARDFGLQTRVGAALALDSGSNAPSTIETDSYVLRIVEMFISTSPAKRVLSALPIVGMGGLGKTTLARLVFRDQQIISHFGDYPVWVHVPRIFDVVVVLKKMIISMKPSENVEQGSRESLLKMLQNQVRNERYLLDVWNQERGVWDDFVNSLTGISNPATGNCLVVTTRSHEVASVVKTLPIHELKCLSEDDCWSIIKAKAFGEGYIIPIEFKTVGKNIAKRCKGLPLAAKVVGGILCGKSKDEWLSIEKTRLSNFGDGNSILKILKLSFDNLSLPSLKKCFAYCSVFPKGYEINKEQLIELWMAEGFLQTDQESRYMETTGGKFFNLLLRNSLLQVVRSDIYGYVTHCSMHDLVHDLACSVLMDEYNNDGICQSRYVGYGSSGCNQNLRYVRTLFFNGKIFDIMFSEFKSLHTLTLVGKDIDNLPSSIKELVHLRYLDTSETRIEYFPDSVGELYHLQTLRAKSYDRFKHSYLVKLPDSLKYTISLRHLHVSYSTILPSHIGRLTSLQTLPYFFVRNEKGRGISELGSLKNLTGTLEIHNLENVHDKNEATSADLFRKSGIFKLNLMWNKADSEGEENDESVLEGLQPHPNLKILGISEFKGKRFPLWTSKMAVRDDLDGRWEGLDNLMEIKLRNCRQCEELPMFGHLPHLKHLFLRNLENVRSIGSSFFNIDNCSRSSNDGVWKNVVFPALVTLELSGMSNLTEIELPPSEVVVFPRLENLKIQNCDRFEELPMLGHLPHLKSLYLYNLKNVRSIGSSFYDTHNCSSSNNGICKRDTSVVFPALERLELSHLPSLIEWAEVEIIPPSEVVVFPHLEYLAVSACRRLMSAPSHFTRLKELYINDMDNDLPRENISCGVELSSLTRLRIYRIKGLKCLPDGLFSNNHNMLKLEIQECLNLRELSGDLHNLSSLETLSIKQCPNLKSIAAAYPKRNIEESQMGLTSLRELRIEECKGLTHLPVEMVESCATSLETLSLCGLFSLTNFSMVVGCLHKMPRLTHLRIKEVPKFSTTEIGYLISLQSLEMGPSSEKAVDTQEEDEELALDLATSSEKADTRK